MYDKFDKVHEESLEWILKNCYTINFSYKNGSPQSKAYHHMQGEILKSVLCELKVLFPSIHQRFVISHSRGSLSVSDLIIYDPGFTNYAMYINGYFMYKQSPVQSKKWLEEPFDNRRFPLLKSSIERNPNLKIDFLIGSEDYWLNCAMPFAFFVYGPFSDRVTGLLYQKYDHDNVCVPAFRRANARLQFQIQSSATRDSRLSRGVTEPINLDSSSNDGDI